MSTIMFDCGFGFTTKHMDNKKLEYQGINPITLLIWINPLCWCVAWVSPNPHFRDGALTTSLCFMLSILSGLKGDGGCFYVESLEVASGVIKHAYLTGSLTQVNEEFSIGFPLVSWILVLITEWFIIRAMPKPCYLQWGMVLRPRSTRVLTMAQVQVSCADLLTL